MGSDNAFSVTIIFVMIEGEKVFTRLLFSNKSSVDDFSEFGRFAGEHGAGFYVYW